MKLSASETVQESILQRSPYLDISFSEKTGKYTIHNMLSRKVYDVSVLVAKILNFFVTPNTIQNLYQTFDLDQESLDKTIQFFLDKKMLTDTKSEAWEDFVNDVVEIKNRFLGAEQYTVNSDIVILGIPFGRGNGTSNGGNKFPTQVREFAESFGYNLKKNDFKSFEKKEAIRLQKLFTEHHIADYGNLLSDNNESTTFLYEKMYKIAKKLFAKSQIPAFIGGDHSISYPLIRAAAEIHPNLHIIHFDAHSDTYNSLYDAVNHWGKTHHYGNFMSHCFELEGVTKVYQYGIRGSANLNIDYHEKQEIFWRHDVTEQLENNEVLSIPDDVPYYVTFDVDVFDPSILAGTATPIANGFTFREVEKLLSILLPNKKIVGFDVVEANNEFDKTNLTNQVFTEIFLQLLSYVKPL